MLAGRAPLSFEPDTQQKVPIFTAIVNAEYLQLIVVTLLIYDTAITLDKEIKYFWRRSVNMVSVIFFANRYAGLLAGTLAITTFTFHVDLTLSITIEWVVPLCNWVIYIALDYILILRVLALYMQNHKLAVILKCLFVIEAMSMLAAAVARSIFIEMSIGILADGITFCGDFRILPMWANTIPWAMPMANGLLLMFLALYKSTQYWRETASPSGLGLVKIVILDQAIYFIFLIFSLTAIIVSNLYIGPNPILCLILNEIGSPVLLCVLGSRLLFHLKEAGERGENMGTSYKLESLPAM